MVGSTLLLPLAAIPAYAQKMDTCVECHRALEGDLAAPVAGMREDIHSRQGLSCADCHGGDPSADDEDRAMDPAKGYVGAPGPLQILEFCGRCHNNAAFIRKFNPGLRVDQLELYRTSVHGKRSAEGDKKVAHCVSCHGVHGVQPASDPRSPVYATNVPKTCAKCHADAAYMAEYKIPTNQMEEYRTSVHGRRLIEKGDRSAPACNSCHGNHGAAPPGISSVANVCGQCHPVNSDLLARSPHARPFEEMGVPACESCHGNHAIQETSDEMLGSGPKSVCVNCHEADSKGYLAAAAMKGTILGLQDHRDEAEALILRAERAGMEVSDAKFDLNEVGNALTMARATVHSFSLSKLEAVTAEGLKVADRVVEQGHRALAELQFRRKGLGVSLIIIALVAVALFFKIKEVDRRRGL